MKTQPPNDSALRALRWRVNPTTNGSKRHELRAGTRTLVTVTEASPGCWYWFGLGASTRHRPTDFATARAEAESQARIAYAVANRAEKIE
jgi:hypothetical protein